LLKRIFFIICAVHLFTSAEASGEIMDVQAFLKSKIDAVESVMRKPDVPDPVKKDRVTQIIIPVFNLPLMAKLAVGKRHWAQFSSAQREAFTQTFTNQLQETYLKSIMGFTDEKVVYGKAVKKGNKVYIPIDFVSSDGTVNTLYKLYPSNDSWRIYDVEIEDVSIVKSYHSQINQILTTGSFDDLMRKMEDN
jgi:phospholipid transport system substrate-binding protein